MKNYLRITAFAFLGLFAVGTLSPLSASSEVLSEKEKDRFSQALVAALNSDNDGVKMAALQQVIAYGDQVDVSDAIFEIVSIYRSNKDENTRILALSAITATQHEWAMDFLKRSVQFEGSERVARLTQAALKS